MSFYKVLCIGNYLGFFTDKKEHYRRYNKYNKLPKKTRKSENKTCTYKIFI